jgi:hypothetical protein
VYFVQGQPEKIGGFKWPRLVSYPTIFIEQTPVLEMSQGYQLLNVAADILMAEKE